MFQLTKEELKDWRSQIATSNLEQYAKMGVRNRPYAFTEHGIIMLASVLKSDIAIDASSRITNAFIAMRKTLSSIAPLMVRIAETERLQLEEKTARLTDQARNEERFKLRAGRRQSGRWRRGTPVRTWDLLWHSMVSSNLLDRQQCHLPFDRQSRLLPSAPS